MPPPPPSFSGYATVLIYLSRCLYVCLLPACLPTYMSLYLSIYLSICLSLYPAVSLPACPPTYPYIHPSISLPVNLIVGEYTVRNFEPVVHDWCNKGGGMCYPVCGMVHIKEPLLLIGKSSSYVAAAGFLSHYQNGP